MCEEVRVMKGGSLRWYGFKQSVGLTGERRWLIVVDMVGDTDDETFGKVEDPSSIFDISR